MHAHYLQHVPFEGLGSIEQWLNDKGFEISTTKFFQSAVLPDPTNIDFLIIMGGPMSVNDRLEYPWLGPEIEFINEFIKSGKPVLGICLGAQLIACAMGSSIYPNPEKEIGWFPIHRIKNSGDSTFEFPDSAAVFHWHGETFDLPEGASLLASSKGCKHQAFQVGNSVIGLQFHLETTPKSAHAIISHCRDELLQSTYIQTEPEILSATDTMYESINSLMGEVLSFLLKK